MLERAIIGSRAASAKHMCEMIEPILISRDRRDRALTPERPEAGDQITADFIEAVLSWLEERDRVEAS